MIYIKENEVKRSSIEPSRTMREVNQIVIFLQLQNAGMRLYGGAQYHRAMAEFRFLVGAIKCPPITREEIVNACGVEDIHDGTNYSRFYTIN